jgi:hypothetical protein
MAFLNFINSNATRSAYLGLGIAQSFPFTPMNLSALFLFAATYSKPVELSRTTTGALICRSAGLALGPGTAAVIMHNPG